MLHHIACRLHLCTHNWDPFVSDRFKEEAKKVRPNFVWVDFWYIGVRREQQASNPRMNHQKMN
jgi:hypothetical protein